MARFEGMKVKVLIGERPELRPCMVYHNNKWCKAFFHCWSSNSGVCGEQDRRGAIVELEDGRLSIVFALGNIRFVDTVPLMSEYCFEEDWKSFIEGEPK